MEWVNYHHLLYFWVVSKEGGLVQAGKVLRLSHSTLSAQVHALEDQLGEKLFTKVGRKLALTEVGREVFDYAEQIFALGREMVDTVKGRARGQPRRFNVGITDAVPKLLIRRLLQPALNLAEPVRLVCVEGALDGLLTDLASHALDLVISDAPVPSGSSVRAFTHLLGETGVSFFGTRSLKKLYGPGFPRSLEGAPVLLPLETLPLRRALDHWFERQDLKPQVVAEFADSALLKSFGADGVGLFAAPTVLEQEIASQYGVQLVGRVKELKERFYAISVERRLKHPSVIAVSGAARNDLFAD